jgi:hypothetical protein
MGNKDRIMMGNKAYYANRQLVNSSLISRKGKLQIYRTWYFQWSRMVQNRGHSLWIRKSISSI